MEVKIGRGSQYVLFVLALAGEVEYDSLLHTSVFSDSYMAKILQRMIKDKKIRKVTYSHDDSDIVLVRMRDAWAEQDLHDLSQELSWHYDLMTGSPDQRFKGSRTHKDRLYKMGRLIYALYVSGLSVDLFYHTHVPNDFGKAPRPEGGGQPEFLSSYLKPKTIYAADGTLLTPEDYIARLGRSDAGFITSRALYGKRANRYQNSKNLMTRMYGLIVRGHLFYNVYYVTQPGELWWRDVERQAMILTLRYRHSIYPEARAGEGAAIIYTETVSTIYGMFFPPKKTRARIYPPDVYPHAHMVPLDQNHADIRSLLLTDNYKSKLATLLLKENAQVDKPYDGIVNGYETYILLDSDMTRMANLIPRLKQHPAILVIHKWQEDLIKALYPNIQENQRIVFTAGEFEALIEALEEEEV